MSQKYKNHGLRIHRKGVRENFFEDLYHRLLRTTWWRFFLIVIFCYLLANLFFAILFSLQKGAVANSNDSFLNIYAFSVQSMATIGYGYFYPQTALAHLLVIIESAFGLFSTALLTGMVFAKFARPAARVIFANQMILAKQNGQDVLMVRLGNSRANRVYEGRARVTLLSDNTSAEGDKTRKLTDLKLVREETPLFALSWTLVHVIDKESPLFKVSADQMRELGHEVIVTFIGLDQDMSQNIVAHSLYSAEQIVYAKKYVDILSLENRIRVIDFSKFHEIET